MTRKRRRLYLLLACGLGVGAASALALTAFQSSLTFFVTPTQIAQNDPPPGQVLRLGGLVQQGSLRRVMHGTEPEAIFRVTDGRAAVTVDFVGVLPDLFREGQGIVAIGSIAQGGTFRATEVLAKHDSDYMPKEVVEALKKSGHWQPAQGAPPPASTWWDKSHFSPVDTTAKPAAPGTTGG
ncbi:MAG: cytochrome c maturation protein CcmE [Rhodospirillales bacterium]|nr:cytochrome c maturation protein CcmE [Rhodospirillales bacterium]